MNYSEGPSKVQMAIGRTRFGPGEQNDLLYLLRATFPELFAPKVANTGRKSKAKVPKAATFDNMMADFPYGAGGNQKSYEQQFQNEEEEGYMK